MHNLQSIFVAISDHGLGHASQAIPVINELVAQNEGLSVTIQTRVDKNFISERIIGRFQIIEKPPDVGMIMDDALTVNVKKTAAAYKIFHDDWDKHLGEELAIIRSVDPDVVLCDIPYLPLIAAKHLGVPSVAMCSLNWVDILGGYTEDAPDLVPLISVIKTAYQSANLFLQPEPSMPMCWLKNRRKIGPIGVKWRPEREKLVAQLSIVGNAKIALVALGGIDVNLPLADLPRVDKVYWLLKGGNGLHRHDVIDIESLDLSFGSLLASVDVIVTKPGYGIFVEAVSNQIPVLYFERGDWPEEPYLSAWLEQEGIGLMISGDKGNLKGIELPLLEVMARSKKPPIKFTGVKKAAECIQKICDAHIK